MRKRAPLWIWALALAACALLVATSRYSTDMSVFLPSHPDERQRLLVDQIRDGALSRMILIGIDGGTSSERASASQHLAATLRADPAFAGAVNGDAASRERDQALLLEQRYALSPAVTPARFGAEGLHEALGQTIADLSGSAGLMLKALLPRDPTGELLRVLDQASGGNTPGSADGVWASKDGERALLITMTRASGTDTDAQMHALQAVRDAFAAANPRGKLLLRMSGTPVFSVGARAAIKGDIHRLSLIGGLSVFALLLLAYRSPRNVLIGLLPVLTGIVAGIAAVSLGFATVHAITIAFGATLMGEAVDYSIYYLVQTQDPQAWQRRFWPTVRLGVATSICGFAVLLLSSFPGLAQLGVFSVAGLLAAAAATRLVLPALPAAPLPLPHLLRIGKVVESIAALARKLRWVALALALLAVGVVALHRDTLWARGLDGLNPAPMDLQRLDAELRRDAGAPDLQQMAVASAATQEQALALAEQVEARLAPLIANGIITRIDSPAHFLPSSATQQARRAALPAPDVLQERLRAALQGLPLSAERLAPFAQDVERARTAPPLTAQALQGSSMAFAVQTLLLKREQGWSVLMPLQLGEGRKAEQVAAIEQALGGGPVFYLDLGQQATEVFGQYLHQALLLVGGGALAIVALLALALRALKPVLRVIAPLAGAVLLVMATHVLLGVPMTLLHLVGLLLIVAVGSNYTLFFVRGIREVQPGSNARRLALASLALANLATILGFGVLAFSQMPVLHALGATVGPGALLALGLAMAWAAAPLSLPPPLGEGRGGGTQRIANAVPIPAPHAPTLPSPNGGGKRQTWPAQLWRRIRTLWPLKVAGTTAFLFGFFSLYLLILRNPPFAVTTIPPTAIDRWIGFQPNALMIYLSLWVYTALPVLLQPDFRRLARYGWHIGILCALGLAVFALWPTTITLEGNPHAGGGIFAMLLQKVDTTGNACPSLHVATSIFSGLWLHALLRRVGAPAWLRAFNAVWCLAIVYSTLAIKQHLLIDVLAGAAFGAAAGWLSLRKKVER